MRGPTSKGREGRKEGERKKREANWEGKRWRGEQKIGRWTTRESSTG